MIGKEWKTAVSTGVIMCPYSQIVIKYTFPPSRFVLHHTILQPAVIMAIILNMPLACKDSAAAAAAPFGWITKAGRCSAEKTRERCRNGSVNPPGVCQKCAHSDGDYSKSPKHNEKPTISFIT